MEGYISVIRPYHEEQLRELLDTGNKFYTDGQYQHALDSYFLAVASLSDGPVPYSNIGMVYEAIGEYSKAIKYFQRAIDISPKCQDAIYNLGKLYNRLHRYNDSIEMLERSLAIDPNHYLSCVILSVSYSGVHRHAESIAIMERWIDAEDNHAFTYYALGGCYYFNDEIEKSAAAFQKALKLDPASRQDIRASISRLHKLSGYKFDFD